jgi:hypothetical protein
MENRLFEFTMKLSKLAGDHPPADIEGAYVTCYAAAPDPLSAFRKGVANTRAMGYLFEDILGTVRELPLETWTAYLQRSWPDVSGHFPDQHSLSSMIPEQAVFFGPFSKFTLPAVLPVGNSDAALADQSLIRHASSDH